MTPCEKCIHRNVCYARSGHLIKCSHFMEIVKCKECDYKIFYQGKIMCGRNSVKVGDQRVGLTTVTDEHFCGYGRRDTK